jgi:hypothetical protein
MGKRVSLTKSVHVKNLERNAEVASIIRSEYQKEVCSTVSQQGSAECVLSANHKDAHAGRNFVADKFIRWGQHRA